MDENQGLESKTHGLLSRILSLEEPLFEGSHGICDVHQGGDAYVGGGVEYLGWDPAFPSSSSPSQQPRAPGFPYGMEKPLLPWTFIRNPGEIKTFPSVEGGRVSPPLNHDHKQYLTSSALIPPVFPSPHSSCSFSSSGPKPSQ